MWGLHVLTPVGPMTVMPKWTSKLVSIMVTMIVTIVRASGYLLLPGIHLSICHIVTRFPNLFWRNVKQLMHFLYYFMKSCFCLLPDRLVAITLSIKCVLSHLYMEGGWGVLRVTLPFFTLHGALNFVCKEGST